MLNVLMAKMLLFRRMKGDDLAVVILQNVINVKSSDFVSQTLPQTKTQAQPKKTHWLGS